jgi:protein-tyrosine phosphatase
MEVVMTNPIPAISPIQSKYGNVVLPVSQFQLDLRLTSTQSPYTLIDVAHIVNIINPELVGRLVISICPGKKDKSWNRNLMMDLDVIKANNINVIVCLLEWSELQALSISDYPRRAQEAGFIFHHLQIRDGSVPSVKDLAGLIPVIIQHLLMGQNVLVHCRGGLGRAGTICACCLSHFGYMGQDAIDEVRLRRPGAIQTLKQETTVRTYSQKLVLPDKAA